MNATVANAIGGYFETLYDLNKNLITFCGTHAFTDDRWEYHKYIQTVICAIPQLIPYAYDKTSGCYKIIMRDGLLEFSDDLPFLKSGYESILQKHRDFLSDIKDIRNKIEHKMHGVKLVCTGGGSHLLFDLVYQIKEKQITLQSDQFIELIKDVNKLFFAIQESIQNYMNEQEKNEYRYYQRLMRFEFIDFNKIYESNLLRVVGKSFLPF